MKVKFISTKFHVNEEKRTVTCEMVAKLSDEITGQDNIRFTYEGANRVCRSFKAITVAYCHKDDKFNETIGKRIAESRAKRLIYSEGKERAKQIKRALEACLSEVVMLENNMTSYKEKEIKHTQKLMSEVK